MVAYSLVSLPLFGSMQGTSTSCAWLMSTSGQKCTITFLCIDPLLFAKFPLLASAPNSKWSAPSRTAQWANSCTAAADDLPVLESWRSFVHRADWLWDPFGKGLWISFSMSFCHPLNLLAAGSMGSFVKNPGALPNPFHNGPTLLTRVGQELDQPSWQE